jgi:phospholipid N-methyltransferase
MSLAHQVQFLRRYLDAPRVIGAISPSSQYLATALAEPFAHRSRPAHVLEVGAGTGAVTRVLGRLLGPRDRLDVCEIEPNLADILDRDVLSLEPLGTARRQGRVRLIRGPVQEIDVPPTYDYVVACLPFTVFELEDVIDILEVIKRTLRPSGAFSYFEYLAVRPLARTFYMWTARRRFRDVSDYLDGMIRAHQYKRRIVWRNLPPAMARHLRFTA